MSRILILTALILAGFTAQAASNKATMTVEGNQRCIRSNAPPDHAFGPVPTRGNPNSFRAPP